MMRRTDSLLKHDYIADEGRRIHEALVTVGVAWSDYQPGNGTSYRLVFTRYGSPVNTYVSGPNVGRVDWGMTRDGRYVMVAWMNHGAYPFRILDQDSYTDPGYIVEHLTGTLADGIALGELFREIASRCP